ncbi:MAG: hypothetical protein A2161_20475, partial [Candidatus Schekmanbacteria bacterium RBG_13_48_7]
NWDNVQHRKTLIQDIFSGKRELKNCRICFDEIHKYKRWKNSLKGLFDIYEPDTHWIVTGSAMLNIYRKGQDSLVGRQFTYTLFPLSVAELGGTLNSNTGVDSFQKIKFSQSGKKDIEILRNLTQYGGFPEPYIKKSDLFLKRWRQTRLDRLINQDLAKMEQFQHLDLIENLLYLLPERVGSPLSINSLREDLEVAHKTVRKWMDSLSRIFYGFYIEPYSMKQGRMLKKEKKWYLWDWTEVNEPGPRLENLAAVHLLKYVTFLRELGDNVTLHYIRDREKREVDFIICRNQKPLYGIEVKLKEGDNVTSLIYFSKKLKLEKSFLVVEENIIPYRRQYRDIKVDVVSAAGFFSKLI